MHGKMGQTNKRHTDAGKAVFVAAFRKRWEAPGIATVNGSHVQVVLFMAATARMRWRQAHPQRMWRTQQLAPPGAVPADTVSIFTDGSAVPRKLGHEVCAHAMNSEVCIRPQMNERSLSLGCE